VLHKELVDRRKRNKGEEELKKRLEDSVATAENDLKLLREILERIWPTLEGYDAVADLMLARRSSIRSRSTSQYLRAEISSLSG